MILDKQTLLSDAQAITATAQSTNVYDLSQARDLGVGSPQIRVFVQVLSTFTAAGAATLTITLEGAPDAAAGVGGTYVTYLSSRTYALAELTAGSRIFEASLPRPMGNKAKPTALRLTYTVATGPMTAGTVTAGLILDRSDDMTTLGGGYPAGVTITT